MSLHWKENFDEIEIIIEKEYTNKKNYSQFFQDISYFKNDSIPSTLENDDILISEEYIKIAYENNIFNIDLYNTISTKKDDIKIIKNENYLLLKLKKKEKILWGYLYIFSMFVEYKNKVYPNLLKCTKEEKMKMWREEKQFKKFVNERRINSINKFKKQLENDKKKKEEFDKKLKEDGQKIQWKNEEKKQEEIKKLKEKIKQNAIDEIYKEENINENEINRNEINENKINENEINGNDINENEINEYNINENNINENETNENNINENNIKEDNIYENDINENINNINILSKRKEKTQINNLQNELLENTNKKVIELNFTELQNNERPARESKNLKKTANYSSTKDFFLIVLLEKAKRLFFKNGDFESCLEILKSINEFVKTGNKLNNEELIKVLNNLSLLYLLTNNIDKSIEDCDNCINVIKEEIKSFDEENIENIDDLNTEFENELKLNKSININLLENIKIKYPIQYLYILYVIILIRKSFALIKKKELTNIENIYIDIKNIKNKIPIFLFEKITKTFNTLKIYISEKKENISEKNNTLFKNSKEIKEYLQNLNKNNTEKNYLSFNYIDVFIKKSFCLKNLNYFFKNIIYIFLYMFDIIKKQTKLYSLLNNIECIYLNKFLINIYMFILLLKDNIFLEKIITIYNFYNINKIKKNYKNILNILIEEIEKEENELQFLLKHNNLLNEIIKILSEDYENEKNEINKLEINNETKDVNIKNNNLNDIYFIENFDNILYNFKKENKLIKNIEINYEENELEKESNFINPDNINIDKIIEKNNINKVIKDNLIEKKIIYDNVIKIIFTFSNKEEYENLKRQYNYLKIQITFEIIKFLCHIFNLLYKIYKNNEKEKIIYKNIFSYLLINLSYSIKHLNKDVFKIENIISLCYLYFCFSFIYNYNENEFIINASFNNVSSKEYSNISIKDYDQNIHIDENNNFTRKNLKNMIMKSFLNVYYGEYKNYINCNSKKEREYKINENNIFNMNENNEILHKICYLIKNIKNNMDFEIILINNKYNKEIFNFLISLNKEQLFLKCIQYCIIILTKINKINNKSNYNSNLINYVKQNFTLYFFLNNKINKKNFKCMTLLDKEKINKWRSYFNNISLIKFKNKKRYMFIESLKNGNENNTFISFLEIIIKKYERIKILKIMQYALKKINCNIIFIENIYYILKYCIDDLLIDFHILNITMKFYKINYFPYFILNKNLNEFNDFIEDCSNNIIYNEQLYKILIQHKNIVICYLKKFLKTKIKFLKNKLIF